MEGVDRFVTKRPKLAIFFLEAFLFLMAIYDLIKSNYIMTRDVT